MKTEFDSFIRYLKLLMHEYIVWVVFTIDAVFVVIQLTVPGFMLPNMVYYLIAGFGIAWASYKVYMKIVLTLPAENRPVTPEIKVSFVEGAEYSYSFLKKVDSIIAKGPKKKGSKHILSQESSLPLSRVTINARIENTGLVSVNILNVFGGIDYHAPYGFMIPKPTVHDGRTASFPISLSPRHSLTIDMVAPIHPYSLLTDAQIAARSREIRAQNQHAPVEIGVEVIDPLGKTHQYDGALNISLLPLYELYVSHWQMIGRQDLVSLARGDKMNQEEDV